MEFIDLVSNFLSNITVTQVLAIFIFLLMVSSAIGIAKRALRVGAAIFAALALMYFFKPEFLQPTIGGLNQILVAIEERILRFFAFWG